MDREVAIEICRLARELIELISNARILPAGPEDYEKAKHADGNEARSFKGFEFILTKNGVFVGPVDTRLLDRAEQALGLIPNRKKGDDP